MFHCSIWLFYFIQVVHRIRYQSFKTRYVIKNINLMIQVTISISRWFENGFCFTNILEKVIFRCVMKKFCQTQFSNINMYFDKFNISSCVTLCLDLPSSLIWLLLFLFLHFFCHHIFVILFLFVTIFVYFYIYIFNSVLIFKIFFLWNRY